jgi:CRISPR-associated protein Csb2
MSATTDLYFKERSFASGALGLDKAPGTHKDSVVMASHSDPGSSGRDDANLVSGSTVARFALVSRDPPRLTEALFLAEQVHAALVNLSDGSSTFTGCDENGQPLQGNLHAYILCESNQCLGGGHGGEVTHVTVHAPSGFSPEDKKALECFKEVWGAGLAAQVVLLGMGQPEEFGGFDLHKGESPLLALSRSWVSLTPFIPTRHPKATRAGVPKVDSNGLQIGCPEHDLRRLLRLDGLPGPVAVEPVSWTELGGKKVSWQRFRKERCSGDGRRAGGLGYGFRVEFPEPVRGPVAVGYGAHFGLGMFVPYSTYEVNKTKKP